MVTAPQWRCSSFSLTFSLWCVSGISSCTGRRWGTIDAREPGGEFASWTLVPALLLTASCSSDLSCSPSKQQEPQPKQGLLPVWGFAFTAFPGTPGILSVCASRFSRKSGWLGSAHLFFSLREPCLTLMASCNSSFFFERNENLPNIKSNKKGHKKLGLIILF